MGANKNSKPGTDSSASAQSKDAALATRPQHESAEHAETVVNKTAPESRFQTNQQVVDSTDATDGDTPKTSFNKKQANVKGATVKQSSISKLLLDRADYAGVAGGENASPASANLKSMSYSGDAGTILGSAANTPVVGESKANRSSGRFGKQLDATNKKINFLASEQVLSAYDNPAPLGESGNEVQGYYGTPKNSSIRSQKAEGGTPADMLVERSLDEITQDAAVFVSGQYVKSKSVVAKANAHYWDMAPTKTSTFNDAGVRTETDLSATDIIDFDNYMPQAMTVTFSKTSGGAAFVKSVKFTEQKLSNTDGEDDVIVNKASTNMLIDMNQAEIARQNIDSKAGRETMPNWSPLGRAVIQPTATVNLLSLIEESTGAEVFKSYKFATKAMAYQLNKAAKDGQRPKTPYIEMLLGDIYDCTTSEYYSKLELFNTSDRSARAKWYKAGSPALLIELFDSVAKYTTKADVLTMPKSLRKAIQTADNNMDVLRLKEQYAKALMATDAFSTIDRPYDALLPVLITDRVANIHPLSFARFGDFTRSEAGAPRAYAHARFTYAYSDRSSNYMVTVGHPLLDGIFDFLETYAAKLYSLLQGGDSETGDVELVVPIHSGTRAFALWDFLVLYSVPYIVRNRINSMRDVLDFEVNFEYPFQYRTIKELNPVAATNYGFRSIDEPLEVRQMTPAESIRWLMPEFFWGVGAEKELANSPLYVAPWYFNEIEIDPTGTADVKHGTKGFEYSYTGAMSMPVIRSGIRLSSLDTFYSMSEREIRLCLDRMVRLPHYSDDPHYYVYKFGQANDGLICADGPYTYQQIMSVPREEGWSMYLPGPVLRVADNLKANANGAKIGFEAYALLSSDAAGSTSFRARCWKGVKSVPTKILDVASVKIDRAQAFLQYWDEVPACRTVKPGASDDTYVARRELGILLSINDCFGDGGTNAISLYKDQGFFTPFTIGKNATSGSVEGSAQTVTTSNEMAVIALHKAFWARLQRMPMVISPWDTCNFNGEDNGANYDPYDFAYMFGLCGFMASDYTQDLYNRTNQAQNQGWLYTLDPFVSASPLYA